MRDRVFASFTGLLNSVAEHVIRIDDPDDPRVAPYRTLRDRDLAGHGGRFIAEGEVVLRALLGAASRYRAESVLLSESRAVVLRPWLAAQAVDVPVFTASQTVMDTLVGFHIHRGALAIGLRGPDPDPLTLLRGLPDRSVAIGLVGISNHDNVGGIFRNAAAFGAGAVLLDESSCDPLYRKALRVSVGASVSVPFARGMPAAAMLECLALAGFAVVALAPSGPLTVEHYAWTSRTALLVGAEGHGLPPAILSQVPGVRIGMAAGFDSLNVATASGIALHTVRTALGALGD